MGHRAWSLANRPVVSVGRSAPLSPILAARSLGSLTQTHTRLPASSDRHFLRLKLPCPLTRANFGRTRQRARGETRTQRIDSGKLWLEFTLDRTGQMHDVAVALDEHQA